MKKKLIISKIKDAAYNLALEEFLIHEKQDVLYLWQNKGTVVIGRNQNAYKECNLEAMKKDDIKLVRRRSGGGAVFHDLGNLNFTIISKLEKDNVEQNMKFINSILNKLHIESKFNGRNDILVGDKKISGNAFFEDEDMFCHHGTLLVDVDINKLDKYLTPSKLKLQTNSIDSVKSRVVNINKINKNIKVSTLIKAFENEYSLGQKERIYYDYEFFQKNHQLMKIVEKYNSWDWTYGEAPNANIYLENKFDWGILEIGFYVEDGIIDEINISTDSIVNINIEKLESDLKGIAFKGNLIKEKIGINIENQRLIDDINSIIDKI